MKDTDRYKFKMWVIYSTKNGHHPRINSVLKQSASAALVVIVNFWKKNLCHPPFERYSGIIEEIF